MQKQNKNSQSFLWLCIQELILLSRPQLSPSHKPNRPSHCSFAAQATASLLSF